MTAAKPTNTENFQLSLFLSLLALACNLFLKVDVIGDTQLFFGATFVFLGMLLLPLLFIFPIIVCVLISLFISDAELPVLFMLLIEFGAIAYLRERNIVLILSSLLYWLCFGIPAFWLIQYYYLSDLLGVSLTLSLVSAFNGILCVAFASTLFACLPSSLVLSREPRQQRLSTKIFTICASTLVLPLLIVSFVFIRQSVNSTEININDKLKNQAELVSLYTANFLLEHKVIIEQLSSLISEAKTNEQYMSLIEKAQSKNPSFFNITTTDKLGNLAFFAPKRFNDQLNEIPKELRTVRDRNYFRKPKLNGDVFISDGLLSRGLVKGAMVAISAPFNKNDNFAGIVFGAINLSGANELKENIAQATQKSIVVITDSQNRILYSNSTEFSTTLIPFTYTIASSKVVNGVPMISLNNSSYIYQETVNEHDWRVYILQDSSFISLRLRDQLIFVAIGLVSMVALFLVFAYRLSRKITAPLVALLQDENEVTAAQLSSQSTSREISDMAKKLKRSTYLMRNFEDRLKMQVEEKTEQLEQLNLQLAAQAREDGLTGLYNRSGFNELSINAIKTSYRLRQSFSIVLIDLDNFKNINDTYGHLVGDKCLVAFANLMQSYCKRETDIIGRYGGEEFVIFMSGSDVNMQHAIINDIHQQTRFINLADKGAENNISFTVSIGVCTVLSPINLSLRELLNIADDELYKCKRSGRDKISMSTLGE